MLRFSANLTMLFTERPMAGRFPAAAAAGFSAAEIQFPYDAEPEEYGRWARDGAIPIILINTPRGDAEAGDNGLGAVPGRQAEFRAAFDQALDFARINDVPMIHVMAGVAPQGARAEDCLRTFRDNLLECAPKAAAAGVTLLLEPLNPFDAPGYVFTRLAEAVALIDLVGSEHLRIQYDFYHRSRSGGDLVAGFDAVRGRVGHVQIAGNPGRGEPDRGEINYGFVLSELERMGWGGYVGAEYDPIGRTEDGLGWMKPWLENKRLGDDG